MDATGLDIEHAALFLDALPAVSNHFRSARLAGALNVALGTNLLDANDFCWHLLALRPWLRRHQALRRVGVSGSCQNYARDCTTL